MRPVVLILVGVLMMLGVAPAAEAVGPVYTPKAGVVFNNPVGSKAKELAINRTIDRAIDAAPKNSTIYMAQYLFDINSTADKLVAAYRRGVHVRVLVDDGVRNKQVKRVRKAIGTNKKKLSFVATCSHSCMSSKASVMHAKFYLFSKAGTAKYVSLISSANPYHGNIYKSWNDLDTIVNNPTIYGSLRQYFFDMLKDKNNGNYFRTTTSGKYRIYMYPQTPRRANDVVLLSALNHVKCTGVAKGYGSKGRTVIRVANWGWTATRVDVAKRLATLHARGCNIEVILNSGRTGPTVMRTLLRHDKYGQIKVYDAWYDKNRNDVAEYYMHLKLMTVNGNWFNRPNTKVTYTGSQNLTAAGTLVNNDMLLRIMGGPELDKYNKTFTYIIHRKTKRLKTMHQWLSRIDSRSAVRLDVRDDAQALNLAEAREDARITALVDKEGVE